jgi:hypothetical protein
MMKIRLKIYIIYFSPISFQMLVVFKSAPILKRTLKVKHATLQVKFFVV